MTVPKMLGKIFDQIDRRADEFLQFTQEMVRIPSMNPPGNYEEISRFVDERLKSFLDHHAQEIMTLCITPDNYICRMK